MDWKVGYFALFGLSLSAKAFGKVLSTMTRKVSGVRRSSDPYLSKYSSQRAKCRKRPESVSHCGNAMNLFNPETSTVLPDPP